MYARAALFTATLALAAAGCASPSADAPVSASAAVASPEVVSPAMPTQSAEPEDAGASVDAPVQEAPSGPGTYITLADYDSDKGAYSATDVVLFFNAEWCSTCKEARDNIEADLASIPPWIDDRRR